MIRISIPSCLVAIASLTSSVNAFATTYQVGPGKPFRQISNVASQLQPGDIVEVYGDATYSSVSLTKNGTNQAKITIRGIAQNGKRPTIQGGSNTIAVNASHYILEDLDVSGGSSRCIFHHGDDVTIRNTIVHDCPAQGILGADTGSGSLTLERVEVHHCGQGTRKHQIYIATDEQQYPQAVFRMQFSYVHDGNGGNNVKSRAGRNEIYFNWIEGAMYHELELIGSQEFPENLLREDSDVVGNVLRKTQGSFVVRIGGDGSGQTNGRYRFVNNTFIANGSTKNVFRLFDGLESVEMHNNVFASSSTNPFSLIRDTEANWAKGHPIIGGSNNWVRTGMTTPTQWTNTRSSSDPGFVSASAFDYSPIQGSILQNAGNETPTSPAEAPFPNPLALPNALPPRRTIEMPRSRLDDGSIDIGAIEAGQMKNTQSFADETNPQSLEMALTNAGDSWSATGCSMTRGSRRGSFSSAVSGFVGLSVIGAALRRRRLRKEPTRPVS